MEVGPAAEPASAKAAGKLRIPGQCDGAGGGSQRAPGLDLRAGLGPGAVLSVRGGPTVEVSAARAGGWFLDEGRCPSFSVKVFYPRGPLRCHAPLGSLWNTRDTSGNLCPSSSLITETHYGFFSLLCNSRLVSFGAYTTGAEMVGHNSPEELCSQRITTEKQWHLLAFVFIYSH